MRVGVLNVDDSLNKAVNNFWSLESIGVSEDVGFDSILDVLKDGSVIYTIFEAKIYSVLKF